MHEHDASAIARDPYSFHDDDVKTPPSSVWSILRRIGPGMLLAASIVGSGELIATTTLGAEVGYAALWVIVLSCVVKPAVQSAIGRQIISTGETGAEAFNSVPGPRIHGVNWVLCAWILMLFGTFFMAGGMFGGVAQVLKLVMPAVPVWIWIVIAMVVTLFILLGGHYARLERLATLKVCLFTVLTFLCAMILTAQPDFSVRGIAQGLSFQLSGDGLATAIAVFGITGVGASELFIYPYWCTEKGYARFAGRNDGSPAWTERALGWIRVMNVDIGASLFIYTAATLAFYMLGAGVLHPRGLVPSSGEMIAVLSRMYTETLGPWALSVFYVGAVATLYGTIIAATAGNCRVLADIARVAGLFPRDDYRTRVRWLNRFVWLNTALPVLLILVVGSPVQMVKWGGMAQALMLPVIATGALYLVHKRMPPTARPGMFSLIGLWAAVVLICLFVVYFVALSL